MFRARPISSDVSAKVHGRSTYTTRETLSRGRPHFTPPRTTAARAGNKPRGRATQYHGRCIRPSREVVPRPAETIGQIHPPTRGRPKSGPDRSDSAPDPTVRPTVPTDRPNAAVDPKPFLKPNPHNSSPKPAPT
ncbi:unnamed protein product [Microthlaspi erraticum]|uniref:Uncharacterized protein n=1 Tax=Microthlaspi erraticum TaxID=1685480 RepID=A0A6D2K4R9_9BRAS|nr:unnamed protein product [Microthlaspi erraticum]